MPVDVVALLRLVEALPQLGVLHRFLVGGAPAVALPAVDPCGDAVVDLLAVGVQDALVGRENLSEICFGRFHFRAEKPSIRFAKPPADFPSHVHLYERKLLKILCVDFVEVGG